MYINNIVFLCV
uniref:Uncharacterized protein n=1 Tax=Lepeophtheirus salmonis TaxID=72036 RepID=A0A0K2SY26_LEPSM